MEGPQFTNLTSFIFSLNQVEYVRRVGKKSVLFDKTELNKEKIKNNYIIFLLENGLKYVKKY